ncbi:MAG: recombinase family protein [Candidatus Acidiferrales bacterium]
MMTEPKVKRAALYARVSTVDKGQDPEMQLRELRAHAQKQGWQVITELVDQVSSAKTRPNLELLLKAADQKQFDVLLVWKFDRVARSSLELCTILERLRAVQVSFISLTEQLDTDTPAGKLVFTVLGAVAEMERSLIRERVRAGLRNAAAHGRRGGRPKIFDIAPETVALSVTNNGGSILRASHALGISYALAYKLYRKTSGYRGKKS